MLVSLMQQFLPAEQQQEQLVPTSFRLTAPMDKPLLAESPLETQLKVLQPTLAAT